MQQQCQGGLTQAGLKGMHHQRMRRWLWETLHMWLPEQLTLMHQSALIWTRRAIRLWKPLLNLASTIAASPKDGSCIAPDLGQHDVEADVIFRFAGTMGIHHSKIAQAMACSDAGSRHMQFAWERQSVYKHGHPSITQACEGCRDKSHTRIQVQGVECTPVLPL